MLNFSVWQPHHVQPQRAGQCSGVARLDTKINIAKPVLNPVPALFYPFNPRESIQLTPSESLLHTNPKIKICRFLSTGSSCSPRIPPPLRLHFAAGLPCILVRIKNRAKSPITSEAWTPSKSFLQVFITVLYLSPKSTTTSSPILNPETHSRSSSRAISSLQ
jgi:hypothetical protein